MQHGVEGSMLQHALKECGGRMEKAAAWMGASDFWERQRPGMQPPVAIEVEGPGRAAVGA